MLSLIGFLITIGILVVVHEYGHYFFARLFKVKVICFSIGFGPKLIKWQGKHNQWCISAIPLGGYVQMLDEREAPVAPELQSSAYNNKPAWQKLLIAFAGPLFNILFAFIAYYAIGIYGVYNLRPTVQTLNPTPLVQNLKTIPLGSTITVINQHQVSTWKEAENIFEETTAQQKILNLTLKYQDKESNLSFNLDKYFANSDNPSLSDLGIYPFKYLNTISYIEPQSAAARDGLREQDQILAINNQKITSWFEVSQIIRSSPSEKLKFMVLRDKQKLELTIIPDSSNDDNGQLIGKVGIIPTLDSQLLMQNSYIQHYNMFSSLNYAYKACVGMTQSNLTMLYYMLQGKVSWHNLGGPVSIAKASGAALHQGIKAFVDLMALISLSLAIMNLLPIPVLDGGHILLYTIELLRGRPIDLKTQQFLFTIGLILVLTFTSLALYNDFLKLFNL